MQTDSEVEHEIAMLHPMHLGEILDRTFETYRKRFFLFAGIAALPATVMVGLHCADLVWWHTDRWVGQLDRGGAIAWGWVVAFGYSHISGFLAALFLPAFVRAAGNSLLGESSSIGGSLRFAATRWRSYLWLAILKLLLEMLGPEALAVGIMIGAAFVLDKLNMMDNFLPFGAVMLAALAGMFFLIFWVGAWISLAVPAAAIEGLGGVKAVRRSWALTKESRWRIFITWFAIVICSLVLQTAVQFLIRWVAILLYRGVHYAEFNRGVYTGLIYLFYAIIHAVVGPLFPVAQTLFYYDQRVRKEGYDLERMLEATGLEAGLGAPIGTDPAAGKEIRENLVKAEPSMDEQGLAQPESNRFARLIRNLRGFT